MPYAHAERNRPAKPEQRIFIYGDGGIEHKFVEYIGELTGKPSPRICYLPTASGDSDDYIKYWKFICGLAGIEPHILTVWVESDSQQQSFEEILMSMDAIVVGGGNTLNMLGIWKYQGIDEILKKALDKGIVLCGGSAGAICWFKNSISDSRPVKLSVVDGLGFLPYSHCSHYNDPAKKKLYNDLIKDGKLRPGYACDEKAGILFTNGKITDVVSSNHQARSYYVSGRGNKFSAVQLTSRVLQHKGAIDTAAYRKEIIQKELDEFTDSPASMQTPLQTYVSVQKLFAGGRNSEYYKYAAASIKDKVKGMKDRDTGVSGGRALPPIKIVASFTYGDFAAILCKGKANYYSLWYFLREDGQWKCAGEDVGGASAEDAELKFREKAPVIIGKNSPGQR